MNTTFDFERFKRVLRKDFLSVKSTFGLTMLILALIPAGLWLFSLMWGLGAVAPELRLATLFICFALAVIMAPSRIYKYCNIPNQGIHFAMLPASKDEKFWSMVIVTLVVPLVVGIALIVVDFLLSAIPNCPYQQFLFETTDWGDIFGIEVETFTLFLTILLFVLYYIANASIFFFTATLFKKHKVTKTILWAMLISFVFSIVGLPVMIALGFENYFELLTSLTQNGVLVLLNVLMILWCVGFYYGAYYRLKRMKY